MCAYVNVYMHMDVCVNVCLRECVHVCGCVVMYMDLSVNVCILMCVDVDVCMWMCTGVWECVHVHVCAQGTFSDAHPQLMLTQFPLRLLSLSPFILCSLKSQQGLLVDFTAFPKKFIDLLELCLSEASKETPK